MSVNFSVFAFQDLIILQNIIDFALIRQVYANFSNSCVAWEH